MLSRSPCNWGRRILCGLLAVALLLPLSASSFAFAGKHPGRAPAFTASSGSPQVCQQSQNAWPEKSLRFTRTDAEASHVFDLPLQLAGFTPALIVQHVIGSSWDSRDESVSFSLVVRLRC